MCFTRKKTCLSNQIEEVPGGSTQSAKGYHVGLPTRDCEISAWLKNGSCKLVNRLSF